MCVAMPRKPPCTPRHEPRQRPAGQHQEAPPSTPGKTSGTNSASSMPPNTSPSSAVEVTTVRHRFRRQIDQRARARFREVRGARQRAARERGDGQQRRIGMAERAGRQHGAGRNADEGVDRVPQRIERGDLVGEEFGDGRARPPHRSPTARTARTAYREDGRGRDGRTRRRAGPSDRGADRCPMRGPQRAKVIQAWPPPCALCVPGASTGTKAGAAPKSSDPRQAGRAKWAADNFRLDSISL